MRAQFVDEVVPNVPYIMSDEYVRWMMRTYNIDFVVHGDDPCIVDGRDVYESAQALGKYRTIPRTEGVSTTEIVGRMLLLTTEHHTSPPMSARETDAAGLKLSASIPPLTLDRAAPDAAEAAEAAVSAAAAPVAPPPLPVDTSFVRESKFLTTSRMLRGSC